MSKKMSCLAHSLLSSPLCACAWLGKIWLNISTWLSRSCSALCWSDLLCLELSSSAFGIISPWCRLECTLSLSGKQALIRKLPKRKGDSLCLKDFIHLYLEVPGSFGFHGPLRPSAVPEYWALFSCWKLHMCLSWPDCYNIIPETGWFINNRHLLLTVLEDGNSKTKTLTESVSGDAYFLVHDNYLLDVSSPGRSSRTFSLGSLIRALISFIRALLST